MTTTTTDNNAANNSLVCNKLQAANYWELWQIEKYGDILPEHIPLVNYDEDS